MGHHQPKLTEPQALAARYPSTLQHSSLQHTIMTPEHNVTRSCNNRSIATLPKLIHNYLKSTSTHQQSVLLTHATFSHACLYQQQVTPADTTVQPCPSPAPNLPTYNNKGASTSPSDMRARISMLRCLGLNTSVSTPRCHTSMLFKRHLFLASSS